jgi:hypothetical protein
MLRKLILTVATAASLGAAALAPTTASAHWGGGWGGHWGHWGGWGHGFYRPGITVYAGPIGYGGCVVRRWVATPYGPVLRWVNVCY